VKGGKVRRSVSLHVIETEIGQIVQSQFKVGTGSFSREKKKKRTRKKSQEERICLADGMRGGRACFRLPSAEKREERKEQKEKEEEVIADISESLESLFGSKNHQQNQKRSKD
jgi:hypothetical protein